MFAEESERRQSIHEQSLRLIPVFCRTELFHQLQRFFAHMMFDSFAVDGRRAFADSERGQEPEHDPMPPFRKLRECFPFVRQRDRSIRFSVYEAVTFHSGDRPIYRHMTDRKPLCQVTHAAFAGLLDEFCNRFGVVLRQLSRMIAASSFVTSNLSSVFQHAIISQNYRATTRIQRSQHPLRWLPLKSFNGKPQASLLRFACACGSPLNENSGSQN